ncbi:MAG: flavin reductase family protein [Anaerolineae bacterium]|nr:flavin reductase family protein [Anaerolineae bacterium]
MAVTLDELKKSMRQWASGVTVVTCAYEGQRGGLTASSFTSVTLDPPIILVCLQQHIQTYQLIQKAGHFGVSVLRADQADLSAQFAGFTPLPEGADRFHNVPLMTAETGSPLIAQAAAWMDCRLERIEDVGSNTSIVFGRVVATGQNDGLPLVYHNRGYFDLLPRQP